MYTSVPLIGYWDCLNSQVWLLVLEVTTDTPGLTQSNKKVSLSLKQRGSRSLGVIRYSYYCMYANGFQFDSHLADFTFVFFNFFQAYVLHLQVSVRLGIFYVYFVSTNQAYYCTLIVCYCYFTGGVQTRFQISRSTGISVANALCFSD